MKKFLIIVMMTAIFVGEARAQEGPVQISLQEAIKLAVENNLDVKAELYNTAMFEADVRGSRGIYDPILSGLLNYQESTTIPKSTVLSGGTVDYQEKTLRYNAGVSQLLPTGSTVGMSFNNNWIRNNSASSGDFLYLNDYYQSDLVLEFSQPLLQGFGRQVTELNISTARFNKEGSFDQFRLLLLNTVSQVMAQYYQVISAREDLEIRKTSLALAERILNDTKARVNAGVLPAMEILNAQFGVATRQRELIDAERLLLDQSDRLRLLIQLPGKGELMPTGTLSSAEFSVNEDAAVKTALAERPDLKVLEAGLQLNQLQSRVARQQTLPNLLLTGSYAPTGLAEEYSRDLDRLASNKYPVWGVALQLTYPLGNRSARNEYIRSKLKVEQTTTQIRSLQESISTDVRTAVRAITSTYKQLEVTARGRAYAEERLAAFIKKNQVGLATTKDVLDVENDLATAKGDEVKALAAYNNAVTQLWTMTGELLAKEGIKVSEKDADLLYERNK